MRSPFLTPFCYDRVSYEHTFFHHTLTLRDTSRSGRTTWGLMRRPGGSWAATACSVIANRDHKRTASRNGWVELQDKHRNPIGKMKVFTDEIIFVQKLHDSIWKNFTVGSRLPCVLVLRPVSEDYFITEISFFETKTDISWPPMATIWKDVLDHFRVPLGLSFKVSLCAKFLLS